MEEELASSSGVSRKSFIRSDGGHRESFRPFAIQMSSRRISRARQHSPPLSFTPLSFLSVTGRCQKFQKLNHDDSWHDVKPWIVIQTRFYARICVCMCVRVCIIYRTCNIVEKNSFELVSYEKVNTKSCYGETHYCILLKYMGQCKRYYSVSAC